MGLTIDRMTTPSMYSPDCQQGGLLQFASRRMSLQLHDRLQSVLNAAARRIFTARRTDHISVLLRDLHWLRVPQRIKFKVMCVGAYWCFTARHRRTSPTTYPSRLLMATAVTSGLLTLQLRWLGPPDAQRSATVRFPYVAAARAWNSLPPAVSDAPSLLSFRIRLKTWLFELTLA